MEAAEPTKLRTRQRAPRSNSLKFKATSEHTSKRERSLSCELAKEEDSIAQNIAPARIPDEFEGNDRYPNRRKDSSIRL